MRDGSVTALIDEIHNPSFTPTEFDGAIILHAIISSVMC